VWPDGNVHVLFGRATVVRDELGSSHPHIRNEPGYHRAQASRETTQGHKRTVARPFLKASEKPKKKREYG